MSKLLLAMFIQYRLLGSLILNLIHKFLRQSKLNGFHKWLRSSEEFNKPRLQMSAFKITLVINFFMVIYYDYEKNC
jgi:hypothetical protein